MFFKRKGNPEEGELVLCTVTKIYNNGVFCNLDEYMLSGLIHISEVAPGRIRNLRDYVVEGKKVICRILKIDPERGHIDLTLRRVTDMQRKEKMNEMKQEQKSEKMLEQFAISQKQETKKLYDEIFEKVSKNYSMLYHCFEDVALNGFDIASLGFEKELAEKLTDLIKEKIKPPEVIIAEELHIIVHTPDGVSIIKEALIAAITESNSRCAIKYQGGGKYLITIKESDFKKAEKILEKAKDSITKQISKSHGTVEFKRVSKK